MTTWAPKNGLEFQKLAVRAVAPLVDTPQVPVGWIDSARWQQLMGDAFDPSHPGYTMQFSPAASVARRPARAVKRFSLPRARTIRSRLLLFLALSVVLTALAISVVTVVLGSRDARNRVVGQLKSVVTLKEQEISAWTSGLRLNLDIVLSEANVPSDLRTLTLASSTEAPVGTPTAGSESASLGRPTAWALRGALLHGRARDGAPLHQSQPRGPAAGIERLLRPGTQRANTSSSPRTPSLSAR